MRYTKRKYISMGGWPMLLALLLVFSTITGFYRLPQWVYYGVLGVMLVQESVLYGGIRKILPLMMAFVLVCALSIIINQPPSYFNAWYRLMAFVVLVGAVSPLFYNKKVGDFRIELFNSLMQVCVVMSVGSLVCYFLGINFFTRNDELLEIEAGHFSGLYNHSMILGPLSGLASIYLFAEYLNKTKGRAFLLFLLLACAASTLLSASRAAIGACMLGLLATFLRFYSGHLSKGILVALVVLGLLAMTFPIWGEFTDFVIQKQEARISSGEGVLSTRQELFLARQKEIAEHPITGVGFCCVDPKLSFVNTTTGNIEPGTSWLAVFSMTGIVGFILFLILFIRCFRISITIQDMKLSSLLVGSLAFFFLHLFFEGYVLAAGSIVCLVFWLLIGCVWASKEM